MAPMPLKATDEEVFAALVRVMLRTGPLELTLAAIAAEAGVTASALVQRFGSKRALLLAHARHAATNSDIGFGSPQSFPSPIAAIRASTDSYAALSSTPAAALRNLAWLLRDLGDGALRRNVVRLSKVARVYYEDLVRQAIAAGELRPDTPVSCLARVIETTLRGSFLSWALYREGKAKAWLRADLDAVLEPWCMPVARLSGNAARKRRRSS